MTTTTLPLNHRFFRLDLISDELARHGYESVTVIDRPDGNVHVDAVSPSGIRFRLYTLSDVVGALDNGSDGYCPRCGDYVPVLSAPCDGCGYDLVLDRYHR